MQKIAVAFPAADNFTLDNFRAAMSMNAARSALGNSLLLGFATATHRRRADGAAGLADLPLAAARRGLIEYIVMFPQAVPRLVFAFGMMWAWLVFPIPIYGTLWLLLIAYLTVFLPLGVRTIAGVMLQIDKSLEECAQMCGASWGYPHAHRDDAAAVARADRGLAAAVHRQRARARRLDPADGAAFQGDHAVDRRVLVRHQLGADRRDGADPDAGGGGRR